MSSTPISKIPAQPTQEAEDPEVLAILKEMQQAEPTPQVNPAMTIPTMAPPPMMMQRPPAAQMVQPVENKAYFRMDLLQKAAVAAVIAFILFYPKTLAMVYEKLPQLEAFDPFLRTFLLAVVLYLVMWKLNI